jgi:hypothetical protein
VATIAKPIDGVNQWDAIVAAARGEPAGAIAPPRASRGAGSAPSNRTLLVIGNSTNECSWTASDPRYHGAAGVAEAFARGGDVPEPLGGGSGAAKDSVGCGFAIRLEGGARRWKLIQNYGGAPYDWCNSTKGGSKCAPPTGAYDPNTAEIGAAVADSPTCTTHANECFPSNDIRSFALAGATDTWPAQACAACDAEPTCVGYTINTASTSGANCFLKSKLESGHASSTCTTGTNGRAPAPPAPAPGPPIDKTCPNGWCLYDVAADPYELDEISTDPANAAILAAMKQKMAAVLTSYREYKEDPKCQGKTTFAQDPVVGKSWQPWC